MACEFLLVNGANVNHRDQRGQGALHAAATAGHTGYSTHTAVSVPSGDVTEMSTDLLETCNNKYQYYSVEKS